MINVKHRIATRDPMRAVKAVVVKLPTLKTLQANARTPEISAGPRYTLQ